MNTLKFEVYKNTLKRRNGFNPVLGEKKYTKIKCYFMESDWDNCSLVTGNFMSEKDNIVKSTVSLTADDKTAVFDIPSGLEGDKIYFSLTGSYADDSGNTVTLNTNLVGINRQKGMLPSETVGFGLYEKIIGFYNKISKLVEQLKNYVTPEMFGAKGDGVTDDTAALQQMFSQAGINNQAIKLGNSKTYLVSNTLRYDVNRANFDGNFSTIKVSDSCQKQDETYYGSEPKVTGSWSLNSVITVNIKSGNDAKYNIGSFKKLIIDCNNGLAKHGLKIENEGKTNYAHIMVRNPALYGIRSYGGNEATFSFINGTRSGISEAAKDLITGGYRKGDERLVSTMLFLGCADTYVTDSISVDFECGFLTGGADNHFNRCHAWCAYNTNIMSHSTSFTVWGGVATFSQCMIDSTKYGFKFFNAGRALINNCLNGYNQVYKDNLKTFGIPYLTYFATASDTPNYKSTNRGTGTIMTNNEWKADVIGCNFDNLGQDGDGYISVDYLPINMKNAHVRALDTVFERLDTADANLANKADKSTTLAGYGISDAYTKSEIKEKLARKLDSRPFDDEPKQGSPCYLTSGTVYNSLLTKADKTETDDLLGEKADLVNSSNIFDFDAWAKELQKLNSPVYHGTLDELNFDEKSITITPTEKDTYTNTWMLPHAKTMKISVKPNTKYLMCWLTNNYDSKALVYLNGVNTEATRVSITAGGKGAFVTNNDTSFITLRFGTYRNSAFKVSKIMIAEAEKESIYLPNKVAEGVPEVANEVLAFEKTTQTSLANKYDSSNIESGTSKLTPYSTVTNKIKSASCMYKTIGDVVIVSATVKMNAVSLAGNSMCPLIDLPYKCISEDNVFCVGISNLGKLFKFAIPKNNTWLQFSTQDKTAYTFADGEQINVICSYKIK